MGFSLLSSLGRKRAPNAPESLVLFSQESSMVARDDEAPAHKVATKSRARDHFQHVLGLLIDNQDQYVNLFDKRGPALKQKTKELREQLDPNCQDRYTLDMLSKSHQESLEKAVNGLLSPRERREYKQEALAIERRIKIMHSTTSAVARLKPHAIWPLSNTSIEPVGSISEEPSTLQEERGISMSQPTPLSQDSALPSTQHFVAQRNDRSRSFVISEQVDREFIRPAVHDYADADHIMSDARKMQLQAAIPDFMKWFASVNRTNSVYWLWQNGERGCDDLPRLLAERFHGQKALTSAFFFPKDYGERPLESARNGFSATLASEATRHCRKLRELIARSYEEEPHIFSRRLFTQIEHLFIKPHKLLLSSGSLQPLFVIISGLDRCPAGLGAGIIRMIEECGNHLPICFLIASQKVDWIMAYFNRENSKLREITHQQWQEGVSPPVGDSVSPTAPFDALPS